MDQRNQLEPELVLRYHVYGGAV